MGEIHDNPVHHARQAEAAARERPAAIVFEMFGAADIDPLRSGLAAGEDVAALSRRLDWSTSGWPDLAFYAPIWQAAPGARLYGAELDRAALRAARAAGPVAAFGPEAARFGLDVPLPPEEQARREREQQEAHCNALPPDLLPRMVEAQAFRDAALAAAALRALDETGGPVLVITGNGHARKDRGVPALLARARPGLPVRAIGQGEGPEPDAPYDLWLSAPPVDRGDPCAAFRKG